MNAVLTNRALNRALLARQFLLSPTDLAPIRLIEHLVGMQAQSPSAPYFGLWSRLRHFAPEELSQLIVDRAVVRLALMRSTVHLVTADDALELRPYVQPAVSKQLTPGSAWGKRLAGLDRAEMASLAAEFVREPRSGAELSSYLHEHFPEVDKEALLLSVRCELALVQVPPRGLWGMPGNPVLTTAQHWLERQFREPDRAQLVRRYLAAFGPASIRDMQAWSGLTRLAADFVDIREELVSFRSEAGVELFDLPDAARPDPDTPAPPTLLAEYDNSLLSHHDRARILPGTSRQLLFTSNGYIRSAVLLDGVVAGAWKLRTPATGPVSLLLEPFRIWTRKERSAIEARALQVCDFAAPGRSVQIEAVVD